jgi:hypothetical protein
MMTCAIMIAGEQFIHIQESCRPHLQAKIAFRRREYMRI